MYFAEGYVQKRWIEILKALKYLKILNEFDIMGHRTFGKLKKEGKTMKKFIMTGVLAAFVLGMTACGTDNAQVEDELKNSISVTKDGGIESVIVEDFTESYYNVEDLTNMIQDTISEYGKQNPDAQITLEACETVDQKVKVVLKYNNSDAYSGYNSEKLFVGTVQEAYEEGYDLNMTLTGTDKEGTKITREELLNMGESHILIMENVIKEGSLQVNCYNTILYTGEGVTPITKKRADVGPAQGYSVIVFK